MKNSEPPATDVIDMEARIYEKERWMSREIDKGTDTIYPVTGGWEAGIRPPPRSTLRRDLILSVPQGFVPRATSVHDVRPDDEPWRHPPVAVPASDTKAAFDGKVDLDGVMLVGRNDPVSLSNRDEAAVPHVPVGCAGRSLKRSEPDRRSCRERKYESRP